VSTVSKNQRFGAMQPMLFSKAIEGFLLEANGGRYSPYFIPTMKSQLHYMCAYFNDPELESLTLEDWKRYFVHLQTDYKPKRLSGDTSPLAPATIDSHWKTLRGFYNWAEEILSIERVDKKLPRIKYQSPQIVPFTKEETIRLLDACQYALVEKTSGRKYRIKRQHADRDKAIMLILLDTGIRLGELLRLRVGDINLENGEIYIRPHRDGRKSKSRTVFLGARARQAIWKYIAKLQAHDDDQSLPLFDFRGASFRQALARIAKSANVEHVYPHRFRHTFAINYLRNQGDVFTLQRLLGHSSLDMTRRYLDIAQSDIATAHRYASPVDKWKLG